MKYISTTHIIYYACLLYEIKAHQIFCLCFRDGIFTRIDALLSKYHNTAIHCDTVQVGFGTDFIDSRVYNIYSFGPWI